MEAAWYPEALVYQVPVLPLPVLLPEAIKVLKASWQGTFFSSLPHAGAITARWGLLFYVQGLSPKAKMFG